jgi:hypothetical protein
LPSAVCWQSAYAQLQPVKTCTNPFCNPHACWLMFCCLPACLLAHLQISYEQLQRVDPAFSRITQGQLNILIKALNTLPAASWDALIAMVQGLGPVTDVVVAAHQMTGQLPTNPGNRPEETDAVIQWKPLRSIINVNVATPQQQQQAKGARKLLQTPEEDAAAAALAAAALAAASQEASVAPTDAPAGPPPVGYCKTSDEVQAAVSVQQ